MKKSPLTTLIVGVLFVFVAVIMTVMNIKKEPKQTQTKLVEQEKVVKTPRVRKSITTEEIVIVEYSTKAFFKASE